LGGERNQISNGGSSTIIGGVGNSIGTTNSTVIGNNNTVNGANSLAMGNGVVIPTTAGDTFAWSDGSAPFTVAKSHLFAVNAGNGVAVGTNTPVSNTALTVSGDLRIGVDSQKNAQITCNASNKGVTKSVLTMSNHLSGATAGRTPQTCACFCDGSAWRATSDVPQCIRACGDPQDNLQANCDTTIFAPTTTLDPAST
jgi:hypothetical protein